MIRKVMEAVAILNLVIMVMGVAAVSSFDKQLLFFSMLPSDGSGGNAQSGNDGAGGRCEQFLMNRSHIFPNVSLRWKRWQHSVRKLW